MFRIADRKVVVAGARLVEGCYVCVGASVYPDWSIYPIIQVRNDGLGSDPKTSSLEFGYRSDVPFRVIGCKIDFVQDIVKSAPVDMEIKSKDPLNQHIVGIAIARSLRNVLLRPDPQQGIVWCQLNFYRPWPMKMFNDDGPESFKDFFIRLIRL